MRLHSNAVTDVGRVRDHNEDAFLVDEDLGLFVVCDGMGGHASGEVAAQLTIRTVQNYLRERSNALRQVDTGDAAPERLAEFLAEAITIASNEVNALGRSDPNKRGMGTTCTVLLVRGGKGAMGHVGDSRLYVHRGALHQLSEDHTFVQEAMRHGLELPETSKYQNVLTRAVGSQRAVKVDTLVFDVLPGDTYLLCSDGLHKHVPDAMDLSRALERDDAGSIATALVALANERGGSDNVTALVVRVAPTRQPSARAEQVEADLYALRHIELFADLDMAELVRLYAAFRERRATRGEAIIHEDEVSSSLFVIVRGSMDVEKGAKPIATLSAGSHFGEMALLNLRPRTATVRAREACQLLVLDRDAFVTIIREDAVLGVRLLWRLAATLSLRLDDTLLLQGRARTDADDANAGSSWAVVTQTFGTVPSPYRRK
jgi:serine/threonine protein phosphatase PrpC